MAEPRIQYARTSDGVSIAYWTRGEGTALISVPAVTSLSSLEARAPRRYRPFIQQLAANRMVVRYDPRGSGMSDREAQDFSLEARMRDLEAVTGRLGLERFALHTSAAGAGPAVIAYAAQHPERVSHLVLADSSAGGPSVYESPYLKAMISLIETDYTLYTETFAHSVLGWSEGEMAHVAAAAMRESMSHEAMKGAIRTFVQDDVRHLLPLVQAPALVLWGRDGPIPMNVTQELVTGIPNARLVVLKGSPLSVMEMDSVVSAIDEFLREGEPATAAGEASLPSAFRTVLFTDLVGHTEMMSRLGDAKGRAVLREHERITREVLKAHGGTEVKTMGDGFMASFGSVTKAVECAVALQTAFAEREGEPLSVRVGLNAGEPIEEEGDLFGATVILASRIAANAEGGEILVPEPVRHLLSGKGFLFSDRGEFVAKGFEEPVRVYEVRWHD